MKTLSITVLVFLGFFGVAQQGWATKAYVTDSFEITLRTGPGNENKIIAMLFSGRPLDVMSTQGEWSHVKVLDSDKEGWVVNELRSYVPLRIFQVRSLYSISRVNMGNLRHEGNYVTIPLVVRWSGKGQNADT